MSTNNNIGFKSIGFVSTHIPHIDKLSEIRVIKVIRSFDVNLAVKSKTGVAGGSILRDVLKVGMNIEMRPGLISKDDSGKIICCLMLSKITSIYADQSDLQYAVPGGLIGVGTKIDPMLTRADRMVEQVLGAVGSLPDIFAELEITYLLRRLLGIRSSEAILFIPFCVEIGEKIALSRRVDRHWRLIGWGQIRRGTALI